DGNVGVTIASFIPTTSKRRRCLMGHGSYTRRLLFPVLWAASPLLCHAQQANSGRPSERDLAPLLSFEIPPTAGMPGGWTGGPPGTIFADDKIVHGGHWSARIERAADTTRDFSTITKSIPIDFSGETIELRGFLRT